MKRRKAGTASLEKRGGKHVFYKKELDEVDRELIRLILEVPSRTQRELGAFVGIREGAVAARYQHPVFQEALIELQRGEVEVITRARQRAARRLVRAIDSPNEENAIKVCMALLADVMPERKGEGFPVGAQEVQEWTILGRKIRF